MSGVEMLSAIQSKPTSVIIADQLRERIIDGSFRAGEQINEAQVAAQLNVSRGPVREALQRLVQEGLLLSQRNRGVFVRTLTEVDVAEIYAAREVLECAAAEIISVQSVDERNEVEQKLLEIVDQMKPAMETKDWRRVSRLDLAFHMKLVESSGNTRLVRAYETLATESLICMSNIEEAYPALSDVGSQHAAIAELIMQGDMEAIHEGLHKHLSRADDIISTAVSNLRHGRDVNDILDKT